MAEFDFEVLAKKFDVLIRLTALSLGAGKSQADQILLLARAGLRTGEIADLLGTTSNTVSVTLSQRRKKSTPRRTESS